VSYPSIRAGRHAIPISHPDKALFADPTITKLQLARHYERVAPAMLPLIRDRPLALEAFPLGIADPGFFLKSIPKHFPSWIATTKVPKRGGSLTQVLAQDAATLIYLAGRNVITPHVWLSRADQPRAPDRLIIDLDPSPGIGFAEVRARGPHSRRTATRKYDQERNQPLALCRWGHICFVGIPGADVKLVV
jgi:bifunctional non-homologous end joining protein LigD